MAKIAFSKFGLKPNTEVKTIEWGGQNIEVLQYLPIQGKLALIGRVVSNAHEEDANYSNPVKAKVFTDLEIIFEYTNISFTEKQREDLPKLYDVLSSSGLLDAIIKSIPTEEYEMIVKGIFDSTEAIYKYQNSVLGILDALKGNLEDIENIDVDGVKNELHAVASLPLIKDLLSLSNLD